MLQWQYHPYVALVFASAGIAILVAIYTWQRRRAPGAKPLTLMMLLIVILRICSISRGWIWPKCDSNPSRSTSIP